LSGNLETKPKRVHDGDADGIRGMEPRPGFQDKPGRNGKPFRELHIMTQVMSTNLIENISSYLTPDIINKASALIHESPASTSMAMSGIIPTLLGSITNMVSSPGGATQLAGLLTSGGHDGSMLTHLSSLFSPTSVPTLIHQGEGVLNTLFGSKIDSVTSSIANFSGIGRSSAASLMAMAAPLVMSVIGRLWSTQNLNPSQLASMLSSQRSIITSAMPSGLTNLTGAHDVQGLRSVTLAPMAVEEAEKGKNWWPLLLLLAGALGLLWYLFGRGKPNVGNAAVTLEQVKLCSGNTLALTSGSFNYNLARYLAEGNNADLPRTFVFDNLNFDSATTNLTPASHQTVDDLVTILKACPSAQVQLAGYTDNTGDAANNLALSTNRAVAIKDLLVAGGVSADRMTTIGYGQDRPLASNDTEDGKARNRRTELTVLKR
jgi:OmpA-OmpF porin, OOP family